MKLWEMIREKVTKKKTNIKENGLGAEGAAGALKGYISKDVVQPVKYGKYSEILNNSDLSKAEKMAKIEEVGKS